MTSPTPVCRWKSGPSSTSGSPTGWTAAGDADELVGYHLEQAFRQRESLGPGDGRGRRLALDAGGRLGRAGMEAWKRGDTPATVNLLTRAVGVASGE